MVFGERRYKRIRLAIHPEAPFRRVLQVLDDLRLPGFGIDPEHLKYALLEMINNSIRAHKTHLVKERIIVLLRRLESPRSGVQILVEDRGPGFDPDTLPYSLTDDPGTIDLNSPIFEEYRKANNYRRFGMGLPMVLRTFDSFDLEFRDENGLSIPWSPGKVRGTRITVSKYWDQGVGDGE
jgi:anti-sigma regulatory factor (Ser/Thr protein kinase)